MEVYFNPSGFISTDQKYKGELIDWLNCIQSWNFICTALLFFLKFPLRSLPRCVCQTVVNFISELQEQMCRFQKEINSKIREKKALETQADGSLACEPPAEVGEGRISYTGTSCDRTEGPMVGPEEGPEENGLREGSSEAELQDGCGRDRVGATC